MIQINAPGLFERICNNLLLALSFILILYSLHVNQMEKREWCATYIAAGQCRCLNTDPSQLLNESIDVLLPKIQELLTMEDIEDFIFPIRIK